MSVPLSHSDDTIQWVRILDQVEDYSFGKLFCIKRATLTHRCLNGQMSEPITRINFERGDSVGILLYDPEHDAVVLVRQFRYPVYAGLPSDCQRGEGARQAWILETVAGTIEEGQAIQDMANKEVLEEVGYTVNGPLQPITTIYPSPGGSSERVTIFLGEVNYTQREGKGGGVKAEGEDIEVVVIPFEKAIAMIETGEICDAKAIIALQYLALRKARKGI